MAGCDSQLQYALYNIETPPDAATGELPDLLIQVDSGNPASRSCRPSLMTLQLSRDLRNGIAKRCAISAFWLVSRCIKLSAHTS